MCYRVLSIFASSLDHGYRHVPTFRSPRSEGRCQPVHASILPVGDLYQFSLAEMKMDIGRIASARRLGVGIAA